VVQVKRGGRLTRPRGRRRLLASGAGGILAGAVSFAAEAAEPIAVVAEAIGLDPTEPRRRNVGRLEFLGGAILRCRDPRFGGWSDLWLDPGSDRAVMISDHGRWLDGRLALDAAGGPVAFADGRLGTLIDLGGRPLPARSADCEALRSPGFRGDDRGSARVRSFTARYLRCRSRGKIRAAWGACGSD